MPLHELVRPAQRAAQRLDADLRLPFVAAAVRAAHAAQARRRNALIFMSRIIP